MLIKFEDQTELSVIRIFRFLLEKLEQITDAVRGECRLAKDVNQSIELTSWTLALVIL